MAQGVYSVRVTVGSCMVNSQGFAVTGVEEETVAQPLRLFPNPALGFIMVQYQATQPVKAVKATIINTSGQQMEEVQLNFKAGGVWEKIILTEKYVPGYYLVRIEDITGSVISRFVCQ
jgi:hypothetical protein